MSRLVKGASSSQLLQKDHQPDQRKIYMDWANHYLRKAEYSDTLSDLHECVQGDYLPKIIHAVVQSTVPGVTVSPTTDEDRRRNIKSCIKHLETKGVNCSSFAVADLCDGNMKAILSLFYSLSQFKRTNKTDVPVSRIARPISPGLRSSHGVSAGTPPQTSANGVGGGAGMGGANKPSISPATNRRTAGSSILTSTVSKPLGAKRTTPYKNLVLSGEKPAALDDKDGQDGEREEGNKLHGSIAAAGSTSRLDHLSVKTVTPGSKLSQMEHGNLVSMSQPNLHKMPNRSKSDSRLGLKAPREHYQRRDSTQSNSGDVDEKSSGLPGQRPGFGGKRMLKQPTSSTSSIPGVNGRSTPVSQDTIASGRSTPSNFSRLPNKYSKSGVAAAVKMENKRELSSDESEGEKGKFGRKRSNSDAKKNTTSMPRSVSRSAGEARGIPISGGLVGGAHGHQKSATLNPDSRLLSPSASVPTGDGMQQFKLAMEKKRTASSSETTSAAGGNSDAGSKRLTGLQAPGQRKTRAYSSNSPTGTSGVLGLSRKVESGGSGGVGQEHGGKVAGSMQPQSGIPGKKEEGGGRGEKGEGSVGENEKPSGLSKLAKPGPLQRFGSGGVSPSESRKSPLPPSGLSKLQSLSASQGFIPTTRLPKNLGGGELGRERGRKGVRRERNGSSSSSVDSLLSSEHETRPAVVVKLEEVSSDTMDESEKPKLVEQDLPVDDPSPSSSNELLTPFAGGKDNRRINPEGMSPKGLPLVNEPIITSPTDPQEKNSKNRQESSTPSDLKGQLIEEVKGDQVKFKNGPTDLEVQEVEGSLNEEATEAQENGEVADKVGGVSEPEIQTPNLSQGSEVATDSTLSSLSLASVSSPPHSSHPTPLTSTSTAYGQQPETGQAPYSSPHGKLSYPSQLDAHGKNKVIEVQDPELRHAVNPAHIRPSPPVSHPLRSPLKKEKAKRARSLSPKFSRRVYPSPLSASPAVNVSHYDASSPGSHVPPLTSPPAVPHDRLSHLELVRMDSPESVKSDVVTSPYSSSRKPLRSSLRTTRDKDSSSSSLDSSKALGNKVTISPRSSQVVFLPDEAGLNSASTYSQLTILSPVKRVTRGRPSSYGDNYRVDGDPEKRVSMHSILSEKLDYSDEEKFLAQKLSHDASHQRYNSTPELLETFENQLTTMKKDLANKDRMLSMYESSMADLSTKVHHLKKSLEEKDQEIKHLTDVKQTWYDLEGRSLTSRMGMGTETGVLSDGCLSDSAMDHGDHGQKGDEKKKKKWKRWSFRKKSKDPNDLTTSMDIESVASGKTGRSVSTIRRHPSKSKSDLMSISEYMPDMRMRDLDAKSYTSEFASGMPLYSDNDIITIYEDQTPGAKAPVTLLPGYSSYNSCYEMGGGEGGRGGGEGEGTDVLGTISIAPEISWITMDTKICDIFLHHIASVDPEGILGLSEDSILHYFIADQRREIGNALLPPLTPYQSLASGTTVRIVLRGSLQGSCDALAYTVLINSETLQSYISLLMETQWLVVMGTKGTCKTTLATSLSRHLMQCVCEDGDEEGEEAVVINYNVEKEGLEKVLLDIKENLSRKIRMWPRPPILLVDNVYECSELEHILATASNLPRRPYIIATLCTATMQGVPLHQLLFHHKIRVITCNPQAEPVFGILSRSLRKQVYKLKAARIAVDSVAERLLQWLPYLLEHLDAFINRFHTQTVSLGPRVFMDCAVDQNRNELETWFINLWNHFVIPYLMGAIMAGIETYTADPQLDWVDVREFVVETYPWQPSINVMKLRTLNPEDVGWNHAVRPQQNRFLLFKDDMKLPDDTRSLLSRVKAD